VSRLSLGNGSGRPRSQPRPAVAPQGRVVEPRGSVVNYPTNPRFRPRVVFRSVETSEEMEQRQGMLSNHALVITEEGPMGIQSREEVKDVIWHQFGIRKHECFVYRNYPEPYIVIFPDSHDRDIVFAMGRAVDGPIILAFHSWDLDRFGTRDIIPYHVRLSIEGLPHHVWSRDLANKVLCAEAIVHFVEEDSRDRVDFRAYRCWAYCKDPSRLPQEVFLSLSKHEKGPRGDDQVHFVRPTGVKEYHVFRSWCTSMQWNIYCFTTTLGMNSWQMEKYHGVSSLGNLADQMGSWTKRTCTRLLPGFAVTLIATDAALEMRRRGIGIRSDLGPEASLIGFQAGWMVEAETAKHQEAKAPGGIEGNHLEIDLEGF
jgi:hypothetical protein